MEAQPGEPCLVREIGEWLALVDALTKQMLDTRARSRADAPLRGRRVMRQFQGMQHQRRRLVMRVVGAMPEVHPRALQAPRDACDQFARGDVE